jgi:hypothetical protein
METLMFTVQCEAGRGPVAVLGKHICVWPSHESDPITKQLSGAQVRLYFGDGFVALRRDSWPFGTASEVNWVV